MAVARPMRRPVKLPGPSPDDQRRPGRSCWRSASASSASSARAALRRGGAARPSGCSPSSVPSPSASATTGVRVAVSMASASLPIAHVSLPTPRPLHVALVIRRAPASTVMRRSSSLDDLERDRQPVGVDLCRQPLGPFGERDAVELALVDQAALPIASSAPASRYRSWWKSGSRAGVLGHQREARAVDHLAHTEARPRSPSRTESCPRRAARPARSGRRRAPLRQACCGKVTRLLGGARLDDGALAFGDCAWAGHPSTLIESRTRFMAEVQNT